MSALLNNKLRRASRQLPRLEYTGGHTVGVSGSSTTININTKPEDIGGQERHVFCGVWGDWQIDDAFGPRFAINGETMVDDTSTWGEYYEPEIHIARTVNPITTDSSTFVIKHDVNAPNTIKVGVWVVTGLRDTLYFDRAFYNNFVSDTTIDLPSHNFAISIGCTNGTNLNYDTGTTFFTTRVSGTHHGYLVRMADLQSRNPDTGVDCHPSLTPGSVNLIFTASYGGL